MKDFKKGRSFGGGFNRGGFKKGGFDRGNGGFRGTPQRDFSGQSELFQATCARCGKSCEVPFRPNGKKPVFCKECFALENGTSRESSHSHGDFAPRSSFRSEGRPERSQRHGEGGEQRREDLRSQIDLINAKLDTLTRMIKALEQSPASAEKKIEKKEVVPAAKASAVIVAAKAVKSPLKKVAKAKKAVNK